MGELLAKLAVAALSMAALVATCGGGAPSRALDNTSWTLESIGGTAITLDPPPTLEFGTGGQFDGFSGCNDFFGEAEILEKSIDLELGGMTARGCPDAAAGPIEKDYTDALPATTNWAIDDDTLTLAGATDLVYARN